MKRRDLIHNAAALSVASLGSGAAMAAGSDSIKALDQPWPVRGTESFAFSSKAVGDDFAVGIWKPAADMLAMRSIDEDQPLDVVYVLDGSFALGLAACISLLGLVDLIKPGYPPLMLVGVDYLVDRPNARSRDYTMADSAPAVMAEALKAKPETTPGGADRFLEFLESELDPWVRATYRTTGKPAGILGDSFGGTFTFYAFLKQSKLFDRYWLGSPGIFTTNTDYVAQFAELIAGDLVHDTKMFLTLGELEMNGGPDFYEDMGRNFNRMVSALTKKPNNRLTWRSRVYPGHTHTTVLMPALNDALLYLYGPHLP